MMEPRASSTSHAVIDPRTGGWRAAATVFALSLILAACTGEPIRHAGGGGDTLPPILVPGSLTADGGLHQKLEPFVAYPSVRHFSICYGGTCSQRATLGLSRAEWSRVRSTFTPAPATPAAEREAIRRAIALLQRIVGPKTGTAHNLGENRGHGLAGQMDCVDQSIDTSVYLTLLQKDGLLHWHRLAGRSTRGPFTAVMQWPHSTAVIVDTADHIQYAVDAWFLDNGNPPFIVPLREWANGWRPDTAAAAPAPSRAGAAVPPPS